MWAACHTGAQKRSGQYLHAPYPNTTYRLIALLAETSPKLLLREHADSQEDGCCWEFRFSLGANSLNQELKPEVTDSSFASVLVL